MKIEIIEIIEMDNNMLRIQHPEFFKQENFNELTESASDAYQIFDNHPDRPKGFRNSFSPGFEGWCGMIKDVAIFCESGLSSSAPKYVGRGKWENLLK